MYQEEPLMLLVHAEPKVGKTTLGNTSPAPRLILDAENGARFAARRNGHRPVYWNPMTEEPPVADGSWETCIVQVRDWKVFVKTFDWLNSGKHPFVSVIMDTIDEIQKKCKDQINSEGTFSERQWGELLTQMETKVRHFRDLSMHEKTPLKALVCLAHTNLKNGRYRPQVQGALQISLPGIFDTIGYLYSEADASGDVVRKLLVSPHDQFDAGDRTGTFPPIITDPNVEAMYHQMNQALNGEESE